MIFEILENFASIIQILENFAFVDFQTQVFIWFLISMTFCIKSKWNSAE